MVHIIVRSKTMRSAGLWIACYCIGGSHTQICYSVRQKITSSFCDGLSTNSYLFKGLLRVSFIFFTQKHIVVRMKTAEPASNYVNNERRGFQEAVRIAEGALAVKL